MNEVKQTPELTQSCKNCGSQLNGKFCRNCGQEASPTIRYFGTVILHLLDDIFSFDSRASRTLFPLLFKPGFLTKEYFAGRRVHYVPPLKLYLFISIVFFLSLKFFSDFNSPQITLATPAVIQQKIDKKMQALSLLPEAEQINLTIKKLSLYTEYIAQSTDKPLQNQAIKLATLELKKLNKIEKFTENDEFHYKRYQKKIDKILNEKKQEREEEHFHFIGESSLNFDILSKETNEKLAKYLRMLEEKAENELSADPTKLVDQAIAKLPQLMFILLPVFALLLKVLYLFSKRLYLEHLTVALHSHSFIFLVILLISVLDAIFDWLIDYFPWLSHLSETVGFVLLTWIPFYLFIMQKRVYKQGYFITIIKYQLISLAYLLLIALTSTVAFIWGVISL